MADIKKTANKVRAKLKGEYLLKRIRTTCLWLLLDSKYKKKKQMSK